MCSCPPLPRRCPSRTTRTMPHSSRRTRNSPYPTGRARTNPGPMRHTCPASTACTQSRRAPPSIRRRMRGTRLSSTRPASRCNGPCCTARMTTPMRPRTDPPRTPSTTTSERRPRSPHRMPHTTSRRSRHRWRSQRHTCRTCSFHRFPRTFQRSTTRTSPRKPRQPPRSPCRRRKRRTMNDPPTRTDRRRTSRRCLHPRQPPRPSRTQCTPTSSSHLPRR